MCKSDQIVESRLRKNVKLLGTLSVHQADLRTLLTVFLRVPFHCSVFSEKWLHMSFMSALKVRDFILLPYVSRHPQPLLPDRPPSWGVTRQFPGGRGTRSSTLKRLTRKSAQAHEQLRHGQQRHGQLRHGLLPRLRAPKQVRAGKDAPGASRATKRGAPVPCLRVAFLPSLVASYVRCPRPRTRARQGTGGPRKVSARGL